MGEGNNKDTFWNKLGLILFGAIIGAGASYLSSYGLWYAQAEYNYNEAVKKSREQLIVEAAELLAYAPRINGIIKASILQISAGQTIQDICLSAKMRGESIPSCDSNIDYSVVNKFGDDVFVYSARFEKLRNLTFLYFCEKTKSKFENIGKDKAWWEITADETAEILKTMHIEYSCKL